MAGAALTCPPAEIKVATVTINTVKLSLKSIFVMIRLWLGWCERWLLQSSDAVVLLNH